MLKKGVRTLLGALCEGIFHTQRANISGRAPKTSLGGYNKGLIFGGAKKPLKESPPKERILNLKRVLKHLLCAPWGEKSPGRFHKKAQEKKNLNPQKILCGPFGQKIKGKEILVKKR